MRNLTFLLATLIVTACAGKAPPEAAGAGQHEGSAIHPDLRCPEGTRAIGAAPPEGTEAWCQEIVDGRAVHHGPSMSWTAQGALRVTGSWRDGRKQGEWTWYRADGSIERVTTFGADREHGPTREYDAAGHLRVEGEYYRGERHGDWTWYSGDGTLVQTGAYDRGARTGEWIEYDLEGEPAVRRMFRDGRQMTQELLGDDEAEGEGDEGDDEGDESDAP